MAYNVKFLKGTAAQYTGLATKDVNTFYYIDGKDLYLGEVKLSNASDLQAAITRIAANENAIGNIAELSTTEKTNLVGAVNEIKKTLSDLIGGESGGIADMIKAVTGDLTTLTTDAKNTLVAAINELDAAIDANKTAAVVSLQSLSTPTTGYAKTYEIKQGETSLGKIDIPKDMVVSSAKVIDNPSGQPAGKYIELPIANNDGSKVYINVNDLVDAYTAKASATQVQLAISATNEISATIVAGSISATELAANAVETAKIKDLAVTKAKLAKEVTDELAKATSAVQEVKEGTTNGTILVDGTAVNVHGLKSAAYAETSAFDAAGSANTALNNAKAYTDTALTWGTIA